MWSKICNERETGNINIITSLDLGYLGLITNLQYSGKDYLIHLYGSDIAAENNLYVLYIKLLCEYIIITVCVHVVTDV